MAGILLASCGRPDSASPPETGAHVDSGAVPSVDPVARFRELVPDSLLRRDGACPFECCAYGTWKTGATLEILSEPRARASLVGTIPAGESFTAETGVVFVTDIQLVVVTDSLNEYGERRPADSNTPWSAAIVPGDTLVVLDYVGEGYHRLWTGRAVLEAQQFWAQGGVGSMVDPPAGRALGASGSEWWVKVRRADGSEGWIVAPTEGVDGWDACA